MQISSTLLGILRAWPAAMLLAGRGVAPPADQPRIDHVMLGVADLDRGIERLATATGVRPSYGGKHPGGTHNALLSLGDHTYLELIAVQPGAAAPPGMADLTRLDQPTPIGWAVSGKDIAPLRKALEHAGFSLTPPEPGSRTPPSGATLHWQTFGLAKELQGAPFFIVWAAETPHPAATSPSGCKLGQLVVTTPDAAQLQHLRTALGIPVQLVEADKPGFALTLDCPTGPVTFRTP